MMMRKRAEQKQDQAEDKDAAHAKEKVTPKKRKAMNGKTAKIQEEETPQQVDDDESNWEAPDKDAWATQYKRYRSFRLPGSDNNYRTGEFVYILPATNQPENRKRKTKGHAPVSKDDEANDPDADPWWIGQIVEVRAKDEKNVFMNVRWMFTTIAQLQDVGARRIPKRLEGYEVIFSDYTDIQPVHAVEDRADIHRFDENSAVQDPIPEGAVFYRSELLRPNPATQTKKKGKKRTPVFPTVTPMAKPSCFCRKPYAPLPFDKDPMVFCPYESCHKWFHASCLVARNPSQPHTPESLASIKKSGLELFSEIPPIPAPKPDEEDDEAENTEPLTEITPEIRSAAEQSITRGTADTGIVGNGQKVILAREILNQEQTGSKEAVKELLELWSKKSRDPTWLGTGNKKKGKKSTLSTHWVCPECKALI